MGKGVQKTYSSTVQAISWPEDLKISLESAFNRAS